MIVDDSFWHRVNGFQTPFILFAIGRPLLDGRSGVRNSARVSESLLFVGAATKAVKLAVRERGPGDIGIDSFPSGHASTTFAVASMNAAFYPREAPLWYSGAALLSISRNQIGSHFFHDVLAGAALGYGVARALVGRPNGILIAPIFTGRSRGAQVILRF